MDGLDFSQGVPGKPVGRNSPTTYNAFFHITKFRDGCAGTVEQQAKGPILAEKKIGMTSATAVVAKPKGIPEYPPYYHFSAKTPEQAVNKMTKHQLSRDLTDQ